MADGHWEVVIDAEGNVVVEGVGFKGKACELPTALLDAIGATANVEKKPEYFQTGTAKDRVQVGR